MHILILENARVCTRWWINLGKETSALPSTSGPHVLLAGPLQNASWMSCLLVLLASYSMAAAWLGSFFSIFVTFFSFFVIIFSFLVRFFHFFLGLFNFFFLVLILPCHQRPPCLAWMGPPKSGLRTRFLFWEQCHRFGVVNPKKSAIFEGVDTGASSRNQITPTPVQATDLFESTASGCLG